MRLAVVGDALLDVDLVGRSERLCPDAPVPVLDQEERRVRPGGAGLAAGLAARFPVDVTLVAPTYADGAELRAALGPVELVTAVATGTTPTKVRVRTESQSLLRIDCGTGGSPVVTEAMLDAVRTADAVLVSDYGRGAAAHPRLRAVIAEVARERPVVWDPHPRGAPPVPGCALVTPNADEAGIWGRRESCDSAQALRTAWSAAALAVTAGAEGATLFDAAGRRQVAAPTVAGGDPCGAGDCFASAAAFRLACGDAAGEAVAFAVRVASQFVAAGGASAFRPPLPRDDAGPTAVVARVRARGGRVVATGGCFDLLHAGHVRTLQAARNLGDALVVLLNSDASVRRLKGPDRPLTAQADRAAILQAMGCVDAVVVFAEDDPRVALDRLRPDVWVKGGDYRAEDLPETALLSSWGGTVAVAPYLRRHSSTRLAEQLAGLPATALD